MSGNFSPSVTLPYQLVQVFVINVSVHVSKIAAHCQDDVVRTVHRRLRLDIIYKFGHLRVCSIFVWFLWWKKSNFSVRFGMHRWITHPSVYIVVGAVFVVNNRLIVAQNVEAETVRRSVVVEQNSGEQIRVICANRTENPGESLFSTVDVVFWENSHCTAVVG